MTKFKVKLIMGLFVCLASLSLLTIFNLNGDYYKVWAQGSRQDRKKLGPLAQDIIDEASEPDSPEARTRVMAKKRRYDLPNTRSNNPRAPGDLTKFPRGIGTGYVDEEPPPAPLSVRPQTLVVIGTIDRVQPYLTESNTALFTEFSLSVENVLKSIDVSIPIIPGALLNFDTIGGALRLRNGNVIRYEVGNGVKFPRTGRRYLLFIDVINAEQNLKLINGYELVNGKVQALREKLVYNPATRQVSIESPFTGIRETEFVRQVTQAIANPNAMGLGGN